MKKAITLLLAVLLAFSFAACTHSAAGDEKHSTSTGPSAQTTENATRQPKPGKKALVVYFTWSGNTEEMAKTIETQTGADMLKIEPAVPYPTDYTKCGEQAKKERDENARPKIANLPPSIDEYDTLFVGYPIWWHTAPMIIGTFLESYDLTGKNIYPFTQSSSMDEEQFNNSMEFVRTCAKGATVHDGLFVNASDTDGIVAYLQENGQTTQ